MYVEDVWRMSVLCRLEFLVTAEIAANCLIVGPARLKNVFPDIPQLTPEEERQLKEDNPFGWKTETKPAEDDADDDAVAESAASAASAASGAASAAAPPA